MDPMICYRTASLYNTDLAVIHTQFFILYNIRLKLSNSIIFNPTWIEHETFWFGVGYSVQHRSCVIHKVLFIIYNIRLKLSNSIIFIPNRTHNLLIWSQTRYHCTMDPMIFNKTAFLSIQILQLSFTHYPSLFTMLFYTTCHETVIYTLLHDF